MKLDINSSSLQHSFTSDSFKNSPEFMESELGNMLRTGVKFAQEGNRADARQLLLRVTDSDPENETAWLWLASISEYPEELLIFLQNVLKINPENARAIEWAKATKSLLAKTFVQRGIDASHDSQMDFAKQCFLQAIVHDSENEMAWLWLASITEAVEEKISHLQKVLNFNPENETALSSLKNLKTQTSQSLLRKANSAAISGERETARILLEEVMENSPEIEEAWILKAYLADDFYEKLGYYEKVLALNPANEAAQAGMASLKILMEKADIQSQTPYQTLESAEEKSQEEVYQIEPEQAPERAVDFVQKPSEPEISEVETLVQDSAEEQFEAEEIFAGENNSYEFAEKTDAADDLPEVVEAENYLNRDSQADDFETPFFEESLANEIIEDSAGEQSFTSESPTQKLEAINPENADFQNQEESEIELLKAQDDESEPSLELDESEFALEMADDSENFLIDDPQISNAYDLSEDVQKQTVYSNSALEESPIEALESNADELQFDEVYNLGNPAEINSNETASANNYFAGGDQPTVEFSYNDEVDTAASGQSVPPDGEDFENRAVEAADFAEEQYLKSENPSVFEPELTETTSEIQNSAENAVCPFCGFSNEMQAISCNSCRTILSLSDLEMLLAHQDADREVLAQTIEAMEAEKEFRDFNENEFMLLGIAQLNAKDLRKGLASLQEASKLNPNDVVLSSKINFLAIRLSEIEAQENKNLENTTVSRMIMVVDDSPTVRKLISGKLEKSGHVVVTAVDGVEALAKITEKVPDLILLDIAMPQMDGYQVCKMIRNNEATKNVPVVMISGKDGFFDKVRGKMAGSTGYITKPFGPETLMKTVENYIA